MTTGEKILNFLTGGAIAKIQARYEASIYTQNRSFLPAYIQSARDDINTLSRQEILRRVRYFEKNSNVMQKALSILSVNVVGAGITPTPATSNDAWNKAALDWWNTWALSNAADLAGVSTVPELQDIVFRAQCVDGDVGVEHCMNEFGRPALNLIECHRISSAGIDPKRLDSAYKLVDGVLVDVRTGKPLAYTVADDFDAKVTSTIEASRFVHHFTKRRAGQYRGMSIFHSAILDLHDLDDLQKFEMKAAKDAASVSKVVTLAGGGATVENAVGRSLKSSPTASTSDTQDFYRRAIGAETIIANPGDKFEQFKNERPSAATSGFWEKLEHKFVQGSGLSYAALTDYKGNWGGATLRAAVASDNRLFSLNTGAQARKWQRAWDFAIGWAMDHGELARNPEASVVRWHPPRRTTVDIGNESAASINELRTGLRTFETIYGEAGDDWRERLEQRAIEEKFISDLAEKLGIERTLISSFAQERVTLTAQGTPQEAGAADGVSDKPNTDAETGKDSTSPQDKAGEQ